MKCKFLMKSENGAKERAFFLKFVFTNRIFRDIITLAVGTVCG